MTDPKPDGDLTIGRMVRALGGPVAFIAAGMVMGSNFGRINTNRDLIVDTVREVRELRAQAGPAQAQTLAAARTYTDGKMDVINAKLEAIIVRLTRIEGKLP